MEGKEEEDILEEMREMEEGATEKERSRVLSACSRLCCGHAEQKEEVEVEPQILGRVCAMLLLEDGGQALEDDQRAAGGGDGGGTWKSNADADLLAALSSVSILTPKALLVTRMRKMKQEEVMQGDEARR